MVLKNRNPTFTGVVVARTHHGKRPEEYSSLHITLPRKLARWLNIVAGDLLTVEIVACEKTAVLRSLRTTALQVKP